MKRRRITSGIVAVPIALGALAVAVAVAGCQAAPPSEPRLTPSLREPLPAPATSQPEPSAPIADNELNLPRSTITQLGRMADAFGYGLGPGVSLDYDQATSFAVVVSLTCDDLRSGSTTLLDVVAIDVASGASRRNAEQFNEYLQRSFCPAYYAAGN